MYYRNELLLGSYFCFLIQMRIEFPNIEISAAPLDMSEENCLFCKLQKNNPNILYENEDCFVILDISPLSKGHILVIPRKHGAFLHNYQPNDLKNILPTITNICIVLGLQKYNILQNNGHLQSIAHVHFHIIPCGEDGLKIDWKIVETDDSYIEKSVKSLKEKLKAMNSI